MTRDEAVRILAQAFVSQCIEWTLNKGFCPGDLLDYSDDKMNTAVTDHLKENYGWPNPDGLVDEAIRHFEEES